MFNLKQISEFSIDCFSADSTEVSQTYRPFPGFKNLNDVDGDGFGDEIIDLSKNDGRADAFVSPKWI